VAGRRVTYRNEADYVVVGERAAALILGGA
jgi:hypothetical protein